MSPRLYDLPVRQETSVNNVCYLNSENKLPLHQGLKNKQTNPNYNKKT